MKMHYDVFISRKDEDSELAKVLYEYLIDQGLTVFEATQTLPEIGVSDFTSAIDQAIDNSDHMILLASKTDFLQSTWVQSEWKMFESEFRSSNKKGNLILVLKKPFNIKLLPIALRSKQVIEYSKTSFPQILKYLNSNQLKSIKEVKENKDLSKKSIYSSIYFSTALYLIAIILFLILIIKIILPKNIKTQKTEFIPQSISSANQFSKVIVEFDNLTSIEQGQIKTQAFEFIKSKNHSSLVKDSISLILKNWIPKAENLQLKKELILSLNPLDKKEKNEKKKTLKVEQKERPPKKQKSNDIYFYKDPELKNE